MLIQPSRNPIAFELCSLHWQILIVYRSYLLCLWWKCGIAPSSGQHHWKIITLKFKNEDLGSRIQCKKLVHLKYAWHFDGSKTQANIYIFLFYLAFSYLPTYEGQKTGHPGTLGLVYAVPNLGTLRMVRVCILPSIMEGFKGLKFFTIS